MRKVLLIVIGLTLLSGLGFVFVQSLPLRYVAGANDNTERFAAEVRSSLSDVSIVLPERPDVSFTLASVVGDSGGWQAAYINQVDPSDTITLSIAPNAPIVDLGNENATHWFLVPFSVRLSDAHMYSYTGLFSRSGERVVKYHNALLVGERVVITALVAEESHTTLISYLTHAAGVPPALPPTVPAFVRVLRSGDMIQEVLRGVNAATSTVVLSTPSPGGYVSSPIHVGGAISDGWFFEAHLPVRITDQAGVVLGQGSAQALGEWMTTLPVSFTADVALTIPYQGPAILMLERDNPSGDVERDASVSIPIYINNN